MTESKVQACLRCGSRDLRMGAASRDAFLPGTEDLMGSLVCRRCGHKGVPLTFGTEEEAVRYESQRDRESWREAAAPESSSVFPQAEARPRSAAVGGALILAGVVLIGLGLAALAAGGSPALWGSAAFLLLLGLPLVAVGRRQWNAARGARAQPGPARKA